MVEAKCHGASEMGGVVGGEPDPFDRPTLAIGQILLAQAGKEFDDVARRLAVGKIIDVGPVPRWIGRDIVLQWNGDVDQLAWHGSLRGCGA
jgi:hypothetical protein